jgi:hypothetical protein
MTSKIDATQLRAVKDAAQSAAEARETLRPHLIDAVHKIEAVLAEALGGERLRGLRNLGGSAVYPAARIRGNTDKKLPPPESRKGEREFLCLNESGKVVVTWWEDAGRDEVVLRERAPHDSDLIATDVEDLIKTLQEILPRHIEVSKRVRARYSEAAALILRIHQILYPEAG